MTRKRQIKREMIPYSQLPRAQQSALLFLPQSMVPGSMKAKKEQRIAHDLNVIIETTLTKKRSTHVFK